MYGDTRDSLRPYQLQDYEFLQEHPFSALWDDAGLGKTRPALMAAEGRTLVVAPAAVRDTEVWQNEAARIGKEPPRVVSYQEVAKWGPSPNIELDTLIMDESQHAINDTSWRAGLASLAHDAKRVHQCTGTPFPNSPHELWGQFNLLYDDEHQFSAKWRWMEDWFIVTPSRYDAHAKDVSAALANCNHKGAEAEACEHWLTFHQANIEGRAIRHRRDDVLTDLPPLSGAEHALWTPMKPLQSRIYKGIKKELLALIPEEGIEIELLKNAQQFSALWQISSGVSVFDPAQDPTDKHSGKLDMFAELLNERTRPTLVTPWFKNSAAALARICAKKKRSVVMMGSKTTRPQRKRAVEAFGRGEFDVMIASVGVVKEGVDGLQHGSDEAMLFERAWTPGVNEQVIRRLHRLGQTYPVTARQLVTPKSVDSYQWLDALPGKQRGISRALRRAEIDAML